MITLERAVSLLKQGKLVAIPTETVYGLAADAKNPKAIQYVFTLKERPADNPLIIHLPNAQSIEHWAIEIPKEAYLLAKTFWPGPLTLILKRHPSVLKCITADQETVALRVPNHPLTLTLLKQFGSGLVAPSANRYGHISPTTAQHVQEAFGERLEVLEGGPCSIGIESTIISLIDEPTLLRQGSISKKELCDVLKQEILTTSKTNIKVPGTAVSHYAPTKPLYLVDPKTLLKTALKLSQKNLVVDLVSFSPKPNTPELKLSEWICLPNDPTQYAKQLYETLHHLDKTSSDCILVVSPEEADPWLAIRDRLKRASRPLT